MADLDANANTYPPVPYPDIATCTGSCSLCVVTHCVLRTGTVVSPRPAVILKYTPFHMLAIWRCWVFLLSFMTVQEQAFHFCWFVFRNPTSFIGACTQPATPKSVLGTKRETLCNFHPAGLQPSRGERMLKTHVSSLQLGKDDTSI